MSYEVLHLLCKENSHGEMDYKGDGYYECSVCGFEYHDWEFDDDCGQGEGLSVYDAALIWASHGKDEDYTFGYDEDELEAAL